MQAPDRMASAQGPGALSPGWARCARCALCGPDGGFEPAALGHINLCLGLGATAAGAAAGAVVWDAGGAGAHASAGLGKCYLDTSGAVGAAKVAAWGCCSTVARHRACCSCCRSGMWAFGEHVDHAMLQAPRHGPSYSAASAGTSAAAAAAAAAVVAENARFSVVADLTTAHGRCRGWRQDEAQEDADRQLVPGQVAPAGLPGG